MKSRLLLLLCVGASAGYGARPREQAETAADVQVPLAPSDRFFEQPKLDSAYVKMANVLVGNGLGDPRGGRFCEVTVDAPPNPQYGKDYPKHGWVLPGGKAVVLLDGLEYPLKSITREAKLEEIVTGKRTDPPFEDSVLLDQRSGMAAAAELMLAGRPDLAESILRRFSPGRFGDAARDLSTSLFERIELRIAQSMVTNQVAAAASWARRLVTVAEVSRKQGVPPETVDLKPFTQTQLEFASDLDLYLETGSREIPSRASTSAIDASRLTENLDLIKGKEVSNITPTIDYSKDPIYDGIISLGNSAVPALIDSLERDRRFIGYFALLGDMPRPTYTIHPVAEIAAELLAKIWPSSPMYFRPDRESTAVALRSAWPADSKRSKFEQWAELLADDNSPPSAWLEAAQNLVNPRVRIQAVEMWQPKPDWTSPLKAAALQASRGREIGILMAMRALQMARIQPGGFKYVTALSDALTMGESLGIWSPSISEWPLKQLTKIAMEAVTKWTADQPFYCQVCADPFSRVIVSRLRNGDRSAIADYSQVVQTLSLECFVTARELKPFWMRARDPEIQTLVRQYMSRVESEILSPIAETVIRLQNFVIGQTINSPFLEFPSFRKILAAGCSNPAAGIEAWTSDSKSISFTYAKTAGGMLFSRGIHPGGPINRHLAVSAGDYVAQKLSYLAGAPTFCMIWPEPRRHAAKDKLVKWLLDDARDWRSVAKASRGYSDED